MSGLHQLLLENALSRTRTHMSRCVSGKKRNKSIFMTSERKTLTQYKKKISLQLHATVECMVSTSLRPHFIVHNFIRG